MWTQISRLSYSEADPSFLELLYTKISVFSTVLILQLRLVFFARSYLRDVVEIAHIFYKIMEKFCNGRVLVQKKGHSRRNIKSKKKQHTKEVTPEIEKVSEYD